jgi:hypothetical protein
MDRNNVGEESPVRHVSMLTSSDCCLRPRMRSDGGMHVCSWAQYTVSKQAPYREAMKGKRTSEHRPARSICSLLIIVLPRMGRSVYADVRSTSARALHAPTTSAPKCGMRRSTRTATGSAFGAGIVFSLSPSRHHPSLLCVCDPSSLYSAVFVLTVNIEIDVSHGLVFIQTFFSSSLPAAVVHSEYDSDNQETGGFLNGQLSRSHTPKPTQPC